MLANCDRNMHLPILHPPRVELRCKLQEKLHDVTGPLNDRYIHELLLDNMDFTIGS